MARGGRDWKLIAGGGGKSTAAPAGPVRPPASGASDSTPRELYGEFYGEFYRKYGGNVYGRCHYLLKDHTKAEDAMQDVFAKALRNVDGFRAEASPLTWLMTIATNHCLNLLRAEQAPWHQTFEEHEVARAERVQQASAASGPRLFENREAVRRLLGGVDPETQAAAIHYFVDEMTLEEVAAALGRSVPTIRKRLMAFVSQRGPGAEDAAANGREKQS